MQNIQLENPPENSWWKYCKWGAWRGRRRRAKWVRGRPGPHSGAGRRAAQPCPGRAQPHTGPQESRREGKGSPVPSDGDISRGSAQPTQAHPKQQAPGGSEQITGSDPEGPVVAEVALMGLGTAPGERVRVSALSKGEKSAPPPVEQLPAGTRPGGAGGSGV